MAKSSGFASAVDTHDGLGGPFSRTVYRRLATEPSEPTGGDLTVSPNVAPDDWFFEPPVGTIQLWKSVVRYVPGGDVFETTDITYSGITGVQDGTPAVFEDGFFDVSGTPGTDVVAVAEISTVTTTGVSGLQVGTEAVSEDGFFDVNGTPGTDITAVAEISTVTTTGTSGLQVENPLVAEDGFFDVNGTPGTDITAVAEISTVTTTGTSGALTIVDGVTEIQTITQSATGTRSNITSGSNNREVTIELGGAFSSGTTASTTPIVFSGFPQETHPAATTEYFGEGVPTTIPDDWGWTPPTNGVAADFFPARLTYLGGGKIDFDNVITSMNVTLGSNNIGTGTFTFIGRIRILPQGAADISAEIILLDGGSGKKDGDTFNVSGTSFFSGFMQKHSQVEIWLDTPGGTDPRPYDYTINSITMTPSINTAGTASSFSLELDTGNSITGTTEPLSGTFGDGLNPTTALDYLQPLIESNWSAVSTSVVDKSPTVFGTETSSVVGFDNRASISGGKWALRVAPGNLSPATNYSAVTANLTTWRHWLPQGVDGALPATNVLAEATDSDGNNFYNGWWFGQEIPDAGDYVTLLENAAERDCLRNTTLTLTETGTSNTATFGVTRVFFDTFKADYYFYLDSLISSSGDPNGALNFDISFQLGEIDSTLVVDTDATADVTPVWTIIQNLGVSGTDTVSDADGTLTGTPSTYTVTSNTGTITTFDSSVSDAGDSDLASVDTQIMNIINPTDFNYTLSGNDIIITADADGDKTGTWSITVDHSSGSGTTTFGTAVINPNGVNASTTGTLDTWTVTIDGTEYTSTFANNGTNNNGGLTADQQAANIAAFLNADT